MDYHTQAINLAVRLLTAKLKHGKHIGLHCFHILALESIKMYLTSLFPLELKLCVYIVASSVNVNKCLGGDICAKMSEATSSRTYRMDPNLVTIIGKLHINIYKKK